MKTLRPTTPRVVFEDVTWDGTTLALFWSAGVPVYAMNPPQEIFCPETLVSTRLNERWGALSRRRKRYIKRWLKDARTLPSLGARRYDPGLAECG